MTEGKPILGMENMRSMKAVQLLALLGLVVIPALYFMGAISIETVNMLGRYMTYAIVAVGLDLLWGYVGILSLCQATFFCLGSYAMGMYLAHHGGPRALWTPMVGNCPPVYTSCIPMRWGKLRATPLSLGFGNPFGTCL